MKKAVLITGTSSGIGKAAAVLFARSRWNVIATTRNPTEGTAVTVWATVA
jgi:NAD(P)-dependent dehydrogenase (short-subunit alcohol dehydrogenase family)